MAPKKDSVLELCTSTITLGNSIAVHMLDYLSVVKDPPHGFNKLSVEFLETSRVIIPAKAYFTEQARSYTQIPPESAKDLKERFSQLYNAFTVLNQVVNKFNDNEKKQGFGKLGKGFRMMFADSEIEKLRLSLAQCREGLQRSPQAMSWNLAENQIEPAAGIGYTALAAVLDKPDPTRGKANPTPPQTATIADSPPELPMVPSSPMMDKYNTTTSSRTDMPPTALPDVSMFDRERMASGSFSRESPGFSRDSSKYTSGTSAGYSSTFSARASSMAPIADNMSEITAPTSIAEMEEMLYQHDLNERTSKQAVRIPVDPSKVPRWTPKQRGPVSPQSRQTLLAAVQQQNHKVVEQLLDTGVPADGTPDRNLLTVAIVNHDFTTVRLLLLFGAQTDLKDTHNNTPLLSATQASFFDAAAILLKYGADCNLSAGPHDESPFARALNSGQTPFAELFLKHGADAAQIMGNGNTALIQAINKTVAVPLIELCFVYSAPPDHKNDRGETALFKAITSERLDIVQCLLDNGASADLPGPKHMLWPSVHQPRILELVLEKGANLRKAPGVLELASSINSVEAVKILIKHGVDPNAKKDGIFTPLCTSIRDNHENLVDILLAAGADPNEPSAEYPAFKCITHHRPHILPKILAAGANPAEPKGIIETAVTHKEKDGLLLLLKDGRASVNARAPNGNTALTTAIKTGQIEMLDILLAHGADPAVRGPKEFPISMAVKNPEILAKLLPKIPTNKIIKGALEQAVVAGQLESVKLLLAKGVSVEEKNGGVFSPLTTSIREDQKDIFRYLIDEAGADPNKPGEHLPIIKAIRRHRENDLSYIEHLITRGADINLMYRGWNAVLQAVDNGDTQILQLLAKRGRPDLNAKDENGNTVMEIMEERGLIEEERILLGGRSPSPRMSQAMSQLREFVRDRG